MLKCICLYTYYYLHINLQLINTLTSELLSTYTPPEGDLGESLYSLQIDVYSPDGYPIETTGEILHNSLNDAGNDQHDVVQLYYPYQNDILYSVDYSITTLNGYKSIKRYQGEVSKIEENSFLTCTAVPNPTQGSIKIECIDSNAFQPTLGTYSDYYLIKSTAKDKSVIKVFSSKGRAPTVPPVQFEYVDFNIEQNQIYSYQLVEIREIGGTTPEDKGASPAISAMTDFEDMFLSDETHQLCIRFNPKVASFKETIQESKINTIGGRFPITFRNGNTQYKEFSIAGLISYEMDNDQLFSAVNSAVGVEEFRTQTNASQSVMLSAITPSTRVAMERKFKLEVLEWLNNGQPKLFRSPTEGNYIVRLNNISLSPNEQLGRLLHSFNASAYEIAECTAQNLEKHKVIFKGREYA